MQKFTNPSANPYPNPKASNWWLLLEFFFYPVNAIYGGTTLVRKIHNLGERPLSVKYWLTYTSGVRVLLALRYVGKATRIWISQLEAEQTLASLFVLLFGLEFFRGKPDARQLPTRQMRSQEPWRAAICATCCNKPSKPIKNINTFLALVSFTRFNVRLFKGIKHVIFP